MSVDRYPDRIRLAGHQLFCAARDEPAQVVTACGVAITGLAVAEWLVDAAVEITCGGCRSALGVSW